MCSSLKAVHWHPFGLMNANDFINISQTASQEKAKERKRDDQILKWTIDVFKREATPFILCPFKRVSCYLHWPLVQLTFVQMFKCSNVASELLCAVASAITTDTTFGTLALTPSRASHSASARLRQRPSHFKFNLCTTNALHPLAVSPHLHSLNIYEAPRQTVFSNNHTASYMQLHHLSSDTRAWSKFH